MFDLSPMISFIMTFAVIVMLFAILPENLIMRIIFIAIVIGLIYSEQSIFRDVAQKDVAANIMAEEQIPKDGSVTFTKEVRLYYFNGKLIHLEPVKGILKKE